MPVPLCEGLAKAKVFVKEGLDRGLSGPAVFEGKLLPSSGHCENGGACAQGTLASPSTPPIFPVCNLGPKDL